jgi:transcription elongation factor Elf1
MKCKSKNISASYIEEENKVILVCNNCGFTLKYSIRNGIIDLEYNPKELEST